MGYKSTLYTLELRYNKKHRPWVARIKGTDEQFGFEREFLNPDEQDHQTMEFLLSEGIYEYSENRREFISVKDGDATIIQKQDVIDYFDNLEGDQDNEK